MSFFSRFSLINSLVFSTTLVAVTGSIAQPTVYWTNDAGIYQANADGTDQTRLIPRMGDPLAITVDRTTGTLFWSQFYSGTIHRAAIGSKTENELIVENVDARALDVDETNGLLYWIDYNNQGRLRRSGLDGSNVETLASQLGEPTEVVVHEANGLVFFSKQDALYKIDLATPGATWLLADTDIVGLAIDEASDKLYFSTASGIKRAELDGSGVQLIVPTASVPNPDPVNDVRPQRIAVDSDSLYFLIDGSYGGYVMSAHKNGSGISMVASTGIPFLIYEEPPVPLDIESSGGEVLWTTLPYSGLAELFDPSQILRRDAQGLHSFAVGHRNPDDFFPDLANGNLYWEQVWPSSAFSQFDVNRSPLSDLESETNLLSYASYTILTGITVNPVDGLAYMLGNFSTLPTPGPGAYAIEGISAAIDTVDGYMYVSDCTNIERILLPNGTPQTVTVTQGTFYPDCADDLVVDPIGRKLFWRFQNEIWIYALDSGQKTMILSGADVTGLSVDPVSQHVYWIDDDMLIRAEMDGSNATTLWDLGDRSRDLFVAAVPGVSSSPTALDPADGSQAISTTYSMAWASVPGASSYEVEVGSQDSQNSFLKKSVQGTSYTFVAPIAEWGYRWRVRGSGFGQNGPWSPWAEFTTGATGPLAPLAQAPADGAVGVSIPVNVQWGAAAQAVKYHVQIAGNVGFVKPHAINDTLIALGAVVANLSPAQAYYWRVRGIGADGTFTWTKARSFTTAGTGVATEPGSEFPDELRVASLSPHPVAGSARLVLEVPDAGHVEIELVDMLGRVVQTIVSENKTSGRHSIRWTPTVSAGTYLLRMQAGGRFAVKTVAILGR